MVGRVSMRDREWVAKAFYLGNSENLSQQDRDRRYFSSAALKFTDSSLGGNFCINPVPQFTPSADIRVTPFFVDKEASDLHSWDSQGRFYSEAFDDNAQVIHMRFGVPKFNSLTTFFTGFYNTEAGQIARTGRAGGLFYTVGRAVGAVVAMAAWELVIFGMVVHAIKFLVGKPTTKYYYLKPTMPVYWTAVTNMVNQISVNKGMIPRLGSDEVVNSMGNPYYMSAEERKQFAVLGDGLFREDGSVDVYSVSTRAQRRARVRQEARQRAIENGLDMQSIVDETLKAGLADPSTRKRYLEDAQKAWYSSSLGESEVTTVDGQGNKTTTTVIDNVPEQTMGPDGNPDPNNPTREGYFSKLWGSYIAELQDGSAFASFRVDSTGPISESFSSSVAESEIAQKINGMSSSSRSTTFNLANGNLVGGAIGDVLGGVVSAAKDLVQGALDTIQVSGLASLAGGAFVDIPKRWESSSVSLPRASYTVKLISPYGNPISQLINIDIPLCMLLAGAMPLSTGPQSFTSPFLVELYDRGRCQTRLGIIDSLSITRGTSNLGFTNRGRALAVDVSFSVMDLSSIMHMPITSGFSLNPTKAFFSDDNSFTDYMNILGGVGLEDQIYESNKLFLRATQQMAHWKSFFSASHVAQTLGDNTLLPPSTLFRMFARNGAKE